MIPNLIKHRLITAVASILAVTIVLVVVCFWWTGRGPFNRYIPGHDRFLFTMSDQPDPDPFLPLAQTGMRHLIERARDLQERAANWDPDRILTELPPNPHNGFTIRLEEMLPAVDFSGEPPTFASTEGQLFCRKFTPNERPVQGAVLRDGRLIARGSTPLEIGAGLSIDSREVGAVRIRARHASGSRMQLLWPISSRFSWDDAWSFGSLSVAIEADGEFHEYRVTGPNLFGFASAKREFHRVRQIFLRPTDDDGTVEVDSVCIESDLAKYGQQPYGVADEELDGQIRKVIFMPTGGELKFPIELPEGQISLELGLGTVARTSNPSTTESSVSISVGNTEILRDVITAAAGWKDLRLDLSAFGGHTTTLALAATGPADHVILWSSPTLYQPPPRPLNVLVVLQDTLRAQSMSLYGHHVPTTPETERLASRAVVFEHALAQATKTQPSCPSIMTGLYPSATGVWSFHSRLNDRFLTLPEILRSQGFATGAIVQNPAGGINAGLHQGYDSYQRGGCADHSTACGFESALQWIDRHPRRNFFLYLHLIKPHGPYEPPAAYRGWYDDGAGDRLDAVFGRSSTRWQRDRLLDPWWLLRAPSTAGRRALYDGQIAYNDAALADFMARVEESGILDDTLVVLLSDHGEHLGEHNLWEHRPPGYVQVLRTPLVLMHQSLHAPQRIRNNVQNVDLLPTILEFAGVPTAELLLQGDSLLSMVNDPESPAWNQRVTLSEEVMHRDGSQGRSWGSVFWQGQHYLYSSGRPIQRMAFWDNPEETVAHTLVQRDDQQQVRELLEEMTRIGHGIWQGITGGTAEIIDYDATSLDELRALGYLGD